MKYIKKTLISGLGFPESPRWHQGRLWYSDMATHKIMALDLKGQLQTIALVEGKPSGLGWLPDNTLLAVSMQDRALLKYSGRGVEIAADLSNIASGDCNDMVVDKRGNAYIGHFGFDSFDGKTLVMAQLILVRPDGGVCLVAEDMAFPNGAVIAADGRTLIVAESYAARLTAFDIGDDGLLKNRRVWAQFDGLGATGDFGVLMRRTFPDGICLDAEGAVWVASPMRKELLRVKEGGDITDCVVFDKSPFACALGGEEGRTLFVLTSSLGPETGVGAIEMIDVDVAGAG